MNSRVKNLSLFVILFLGWDGFRSPPPQSGPPLPRKTSRRQAFLNRQMRRPIILYREENTDDTKNFRTVYLRMKMLTEAGRKYADVEIPVGRNPFTISQLSGRTVHADGLDHSAGRPTRG